MLNPIPLYIRCVGLERPLTPSVWFDNWYWINILLFYLTSVLSMSLWRARQNKLENVPCSTFNEWRVTVSKETVVLIRWEIETRKFVLPNESFRFKFPPCENQDWQRATGRSNLQLCDTFRVVICPRMDSFAMLIESATYSFLMLTTPVEKKKTKRSLFLEHTRNYTLRNTPKNINIYQAFLYFYAYAI